MLSIEYDHDLVEQTTFLAARRDKRLERDLHLDIDSLYEISDEELRRRKFEAVFRGFFTKFGLNRVIADLIAEAPLVGERVGRYVAREALREKDESAELFVRDTDAGATPSERTLVIQVCPQSLIDPERFAPRLRRELLHVADMLDERFGYVREGIAGLPARQNLVRDRYRVLWDIYIEGRLDREGRSDAAMARSLRGAFNQAFSGRAPHAYDRAFSQVFDTPVLTHRRLLDWAHDPGGLFDKEAKSLPPMRQSSGERCPLCGFPTHDWFEFSEDGNGSVASRIERDHANWSAESGACRQCAEIYAAGVSG
jgi:hypothetical protein